MTQSNTPAVANPTQIRENQELRVRAMEMALIFWNDQPLTPEELVRAADKIYNYLTQGTTEEERVHERVQ